jgi:hypothetical protein
MIAPNDGGQVAPTMIPDGFGGLEPIRGITMRDWFAGMALQGLMVRYDEHPNNAKLCAEIAYEASDFMLAARERKEDA